MALDNLMRPGLTEFLIVDLADSPVPDEEVLTNLGQISLFQIHAENLYNSDRSSMKTKP